MRFRNTTAREELMKPEEVYAISIELTNTAMTFLKGHRLRLIIQPISFPVQVQTAFKTALTEAPLLRASYGASSLV